MALRVGDIRMFLVVEKEWRNFYVEVKDSENERRIRMTQTTTPQISTE